MSNGPFAGFPIESLKYLLDGSFHAVDSDQLSLKFVPNRHSRSAASKAKPKLLEPIMKLEIVTPEEYMGDIIGDLKPQTGDIEGMETKGRSQCYQGKSSLVRTIWLCYCIADFIFRQGNINNGIHPLSGSTQKR